MQSPKSKISFRLLKIFYSSPNDVLFQLTTVLTPWELNLIDVGELLGRASELLKRCNVNFWTMQEGIRVLSHPPPVAACRALHWSH